LTDRNQHGPSTRLVQTRARQHGRCWRVMETGHPSTWAVNSGSGNRALVVKAMDLDFLKLIHFSSCCVLYKLPVTSSSVSGRNCSHDPEKKSVVGMSIFGALKCGKVWCQKISFCDLLWVTLAYLCNVICSVSLRHIVFFHQSLWFDFPIALYSVITVFGNISFKNKKDAVISIDWRQLFIIRLLRMRVVTANYWCLWWIWSPELSWNESH